MAKILIVEDYGDRIEALEALLIKFGHQTANAFSIADAQRKLLSFVPALILIDVLLGKYSGKDLCREIRKADNKVPIILMSGNPALLFDYEACEANDILEKPFSVRTITEKIAGQLS